MRGEGRRGQTMRGEGRRGHLEQRNHSACCLMVVAQWSVQGPGANFPVNSEMGWMLSLSEPLKEPLTVTWTTTPTMWLGNCVCRLSVTTACQGN